jgi:hypothetical protein
MAYTLPQTINWASAYVQGLPLAAWTGSEPAITIASMIRATILSAPFTWAFNRAEDTSTTLVIGQQDYTTSISSFGFLERASLLDPTDGKWYEIPDVKNNATLAKSSTKARPQVIAVQNTTGPVLRFSAVPDKAYPLAMVYQKDSTLFTATTDNWGPLPDSFIMIYNNLFLGEILADADDQRSQVYRQRGVAMLLAKAEGLSETDKQTFAQQYIQHGVGIMVPGLKAQQGVSARQV